MAIKSRSTGSKAKKAPSKTKGRTALKSKPKVVSKTTRGKKVAVAKPASAKKKASSKSKNKSGLPVSPLAPARFPDVADVPGLEMATSRAEIKYKAREDLLLAVMAPGTTVAGALTRSRTASAPVDWCRTNLEGGEGRVLVSTSGNANAFTGRAGMETVKVTAAAAAKLAGVRQKDVFIGSTGVIGETMPNDKITGALPAAFDALKPGGFEMAARSIMTTDTFPKAASRTVEIDGSPVVISGIAKGSGMIAPDLATMLSYIFTNASISQRTLGALLDLNLRDSFNAITVDSDTSTSDTVLLFATGRGPDGGKAPYAQITRPGDPKLRAFRQALSEVMHDLAMQVVRDGEGATKFISITVKGGESHNSARRIAMAVANSPLVKTAIAGQDANWGRVVMAVGKAGEPADRDKLSIGFGGVEVAKAGRAVEGYNEAPVAKHLKGQDISIDIDVGVGQGEATVYTCDLTHGYISINADYRS
ncbi:bifunctional glutamate N-acetyltransferase/amino-acid acetyltransferase ArgJ [Pyruvatibacter sp.]